MCFLNQAYWLKVALAWFLKIVLPRKSVCVCIYIYIYMYAYVDMCVCSLSINDQWYDMEPLWLIRQVLQLLNGSCSQQLSLVVMVLQIACCRNWPNKTELALFKPLLLH